MQDMPSIRRSLQGILLLLVFATTYFAKDLLLPVVLGLLLTLTLSPLVRTCERIGIARPISATVIVLTIGLAAAASLMTLSVVVGQWVEEAPEITAELREKLAGISDSVKAVQDASDEVQELTEANGSDVQKVAVQQPGVLNSAITSVAGFAVSLGIGFVLALLMLSSNDLLYLKIIESLPTFKDKRLAFKVARDIERKISRYLLSITIINAGLGLAIGLAMFALGVPYAYVWGIAAFLLNYLPFLGAIGGTVLVGAFAIVTFDSLAYAALIPVTYLLLTSLEGQFITPIVLGRRLEMNSIAVFLAVVLWAWVWGISGALMAVPILLLVKVISDHVPAMSTLSIFLSGRSAEQRLPDADSATEN